MDIENLDNLKEVSMRDLADITSEINTVGKRFMTRVFVIERCEEVYSLGEHPSKQWVELLSNKIAYTPT